ncbi:MAG: PDGLE domain-containing protein [Spirochaetales bacterium]|nr:PDGLE domain-containing protein [Spirochaetales bacterium]
MTTIKKLSIGLIVLAILTPIGLWLPTQFKAGDAWGEWGTEYFEEELGYIPEKMQETAELWNAPMPDYAFATEDEASTTMTVFSYILSAIIGIIICFGLVFFLGWILSKKKRTKSDV